MVVPASTMVLALVTAMVAPTPQVARASPLALRSLRDLALVSAQLRELQGAVQPAAESSSSLPAQARELAALQTALDQGTSTLSTSLRALQLAVQKSALNTAIEEDGGSGGATDDDAQEARGSGGSGSGGESLKSLVERASQLQQQVAEQRTLLLLLEEQGSGSDERTREAFALLDTNDDGELQVRRRVTRPAPRSTHHLPNSPTLHDHLRKECPSVSPLRARCRRAAPVAAPVAAPCTAAAPSPSPRRARRRERSRAALTLRAVGRVRGGRRRASLPRRDAWERFEPPDTIAFRGGRRRRVGDALL